MFFFFNGLEEILQDTKETRLGKPDWARTNRLHGDGFHSDMINVRLMDKHTVQSIIKSSLVVMSSAPPGLVVSVHTGRLCVLCWHELQEV